jgi:TIR domain
MNVFISYRHKDWGIARQIAEQLRRRINGFVFFDERSIDQADFEKSILFHLRQSRVVVVIVTENTFAVERIRHNDDWIRREMKEALYLGKDIVPVKINAPFPPPHHLPPDIQHITRMNSLEMYLGHRLKEASLQNLVDLINRISGSEGENILYKTKGALLQGNYQGAWRELEKALDELSTYAEPRYIARGDFYRALIQLNGKRPYIQTFPTMREVEAWMKSAISRHKTVTYLLGLGLFTLDFSHNGLSDYEEKGLALLHEASRFPQTAEDNELFEILETCQPDIVNDYLNNN